MKRGAAKDLISDRINSAAKRMYAEYGDCPSAHCDTCCNFQSTAEANGAKACIAYGAWKAWDPNTYACGIYNVAFRGLRPRRRPLGELYEKSKKTNTQETNCQESIFTVEGV